MPGKLQAITAAAGAGKTTRIVGDIADEVTKRSPESILATTFTIKAADELVERARAELFRRGQHEAAARLLGARFGTVNAVCGQIVGEFALDLGRSPATAVIGETNEALSFSIAADTAIATHAPILNRIADLFGDNDPRPPHKERPDWRKTVRSIVTLARANGIGPDELRHSAERSIESFLDLLPRTTSTSEILDADLAAAIAHAVDLCPANPSASGRPDAEALRSVHEEAVRLLQIGKLGRAQLLQLEIGELVKDHELGDGVRPECFRDLSARDLAIIERKGAKVERLIGNLRRSQVRISGDQLRRVRNAHFGISLSLGFVDKG